MLECVYCRVTYIGCICSHLRVGQISKVQHHDPKQLPTLSPILQAGGPKLVDCPQLPILQAYIRSQTCLHPQPDDLQGRD
jgi:hypothetical protein